MILFEDPKLSRHKWLFLAGGVACLFIAFLLTALFGGKFAPEETPKEDPTEFEVLEEGATATNRWMVYVTGAVMRPGVYEVPAGARINDALQEAGGFSIHADPEAVNLAAKIEDGVHIRIPEKDETAQGEQGTPVAPAGAAASPQNISSTGKIQPQAGKIDINRASALELQSLPGIGPKLSQAIVNYRKANGSFKSTEDLKRVKPDCQIKCNTLDPVAFPPQKPVTECATPAFYAGGC